MSADKRADPQSRSSPADAAGHASGHDSAIDASVLAEYRNMGTDGADDFVTELIDVYLAESAACVTTLTDAAARRDAPGLRRAAHSLKGSSSAVGARTLAGVCETLEALAAIPTFEGMPALLTAIADELARVRAALQAERS